MSIKRIKIRYLDTYDEVSDLKEVSKRLDKHSERWRIDVINWQEYNYSPEVEFVIAYSKSEIFVKYFVEEDFVKAEKSIDNEMVCEDSCVEFFVDPEESGQYFNFEFNSIGTCYMGSGTGRDDSKPVDKEKVSRVRRLSTNGSKVFSEREGRQKWELTVAIPISLIFEKVPADLKGRSLKSNFYKCGDKLSKPHFLTWNPVGTVSPDFHQPDYFGELIFE